MGQVGAHTSLRCGSVSLSKVIAIVLCLPVTSAWAQDNTAPVPAPDVARADGAVAAPESSDTDTDRGTADATTLGTIDVVGEAVGGNTVPPAYAGGQVATGGRIGALGEKDAANVPFSVISYTDQLIKNQQASTVGDVLLNNASVQQAFGFGNFAQIFLVRGFRLAGDDLSFGGLYGVLPRQIVQTNFVNRVELFLGANAFTNGVSPTGSGVGGQVNLEPKRAEDQPTRQFTLGYASDARFIQSFDLGQRFGDDKQFGARLNVRHEKGDTAIDGANLGDTSVGLGLDYRGERARLSFDFGYQRQHIKHGRSVVYTSGLTGNEIPAPPDASTNYAPSFNSSELENEFGMLRGEFDITNHWTAYAAVGANHGKEDGQYGSPTVTNLNGDATVSRLGVPYETHAFTGQAGLRGAFDTGAISHRIALGYSGYYQRSDTAYTLSDTVDTNIYEPRNIGYLPTLFEGGDLDDPNVRNRVRSSGWSFSDTLGFFGDRVLVTAGARYQANHVFNYTYEGEPSGGAIRGHDVSPAYGIVYKPTSWASLYANHIEGLQPGDAAPSGAANVGEVVGLVDSSQYEVGGKLDFGTMGGSLSLYQIRQPQGYINDNGIYGYFGDQRNRGVELNVYGKPTELLTINASATYIDADQVDTNNPATDGRTAVGVPDYRLVLGGDYQLPGAPRWHLNGRVIRSGKQYADATNDLKVDGWTRVDLGVRYRMPLGPNDARNIVWRANVDNVADSDYWASAQGGYLSQGEPRTFKLSATVNFD
ncbi:TonB-dependent siderophore receptor [Salinisphaera sp. Q1T1-3]|uniref:TonB-dependent receptor n=1 Tax=Salinisphaera sp. Q1T1-3 TaxID=2321229 RepID=UPI001F1ABC36|nr:TonB-dependent siderophore receptor [Salinisphaera sp. Q1T1-3]